MKFSIIIPAKNEEQNISLCLAAIMNQNFIKDGFEVIVVDNGSTDSTVSIVEKFSFPVYIKPHLSLSGLRNFGAAAASGDILVFLDADCIPDFNWLENAANTLDSYDVGCIGSTPEAPNNGTWVEKVWSSFRTRRKCKCYTSWINSSNLMVRKEYFDEIGGFNEEVKTCEDVDICMRLTKICKILFDPSIKVVHLKEPKTIREFFLKEIWRGKGTISGIISHGISLSEITSLLLPLYYVVVTIGIVLSLFIFNTIFFGIFIILYLLPSLIFSIWVIEKTRKFHFIFGYFILFIVYANARAVAIFSR